MFLTLEKPFTAESKWSAQLDLHARARGGDRRRPVQPRLHRRRPTTRGTRRPPTSGTASWPPASTSSPPASARAPSSSSPPASATRSRTSRRASASTRSSILLYTGRPDGTFAYKSVDLRLDKVFRIGERQAVELTAQVFNLFNWDNYTGYKPVHPAAAGDRTPTSASRLARTRSAGFSSASRTASERVDCERPRRRLAARRRRPPSSRCLPRPPPAARPARRARCPPLFDESRRGRSATSGSTADPRPASCPTATRAGRRPASPPSASRLTAYPIGVERGYVTRAQAAARVLTTLRFFDAAPQGPEPEGRTGHRGFFYHFLDMRDRPPRRAPTSSSPPSTRRCCWRGCSSASRTSTVRAPTSAPSASWPSASTAASTGRGPRRGRRSSRMGWRPEVGHYPSEWRIYDESMILYLLALGSPTHPLPDDAWREYTRDRTLHEYRGQTPRELRAAVRPPVLARLDRLPRHPGRLDGGQGARLLRELAAGHARAAGVRDREPRRLEGLRAGRLGPHRLRRPRRDGDRGRPRRSTFWGYARAGRRLRRGARRRHDRADRRARLAAVRARDRGAGGARDAAGATARTSTSTFGFLDAFNPSVPDGTPVAPGPRRARARAGSTPTTSASTRGRSWP